MKQFSHFLKEVVIPLFLLQNFTNPTNFRLLVKRVDKMNKMYYYEIIL